MQYRAPSGLGVPQAEQTDIAGAYEDMSPPAAGHAGPQRERSTVKVDVMGPFLPRLPPSDDGRRSPRARRRRSVGGACDREVMDEMAMLRGLLDSRLGACPDCADERFLVPVRRGVSVRGRSRVVVVIVDLLACGSR